MMLSELTIVLVERQKLHESHSCLRPSQTKSVVVCSLEWLEGSDTLKDNHATDIFCDFNCSPVTIAWARLA